MTVILCLHVTLPLGRCWDIAPSQMLQQFDIENGGKWIAIYNNKRLLLPIYIHHHVNKSLVGYSDSPPTYQVLTLMSQDLDTKTPEPDKNLTAQSTP